MRRLPWLLILAACQRPPETPAGLDESLRHLMGAFYGTDEEISAGLTGLLEWYDSEGVDLIGKSANLDNLGSFELEELGEDDVDALEPRPGGDPRDAPGVIAVAELPCGWRRAESLLIRPDQDVVFTDFDFYDRAYTTDRGVYDDARQRDAYSRVDSPMSADDMPEDVFLRTENSTSGTEMGVTIPFDLHMHARHGLFELGDDVARAGLYTTWMPARAEAEGGANSVEQSYTFEVDLERGDQTLWVYASWAEVVTSVFESDSTILLATSANKARGTAERMADICDGAVDLTQE